MAMLEAEAEAEAEQLAVAISSAARTRRALCIRGSGSKDFYGGELQGELLSLSGYAGIVEYDPAELVITARSGTPLLEIENLLAASGQFLPFEPPRFGGGTLGGCVASGLSGPARAYAGSVRDFMLGVRMLDGLGKELRFGGRVMKNVAGYDVPRLMVGALGTLGVLLEVSLKVLPVRPELTLRFECGESDALHLMTGWLRRGVVPSATCHCDDVLHVRFAGSEAALGRVRREFGGDRVDDGSRFWQSIRDHTADFFERSPVLWRIGVPATAAPLDVAARQLIEWGGAQRWLSGGLDADELRSQAEVRGGHATLFRAARHGHVQVFHPLRPPLAVLHRRLKRVFDPRGIFNPHRMDSF